MSVLSLIRTRLQQGNKTTGFPDAPAKLPERFRGRPQLDDKRCTAAGGCTECVAACPTGAIALKPLRLDLGRCTFCGACQDACPTEAIRFLPDVRLAARTRQALVVGSSEEALATSLDDKMRSLFGRSLRLRQVSAGGCNGCEAELIAAGNVVFDMGRFGVQFVASPRHADGIVITGPVSRNMERALRDTYAAVPSPRLVIAVGACAISGGPFIDADHGQNGVPKDLPVDLYLAGCPPHPLTILDGLLRLLGRIQDPGLPARPGVL